VSHEDLRPRRHPDCAFRRIQDEGGLVVLPGRAQVKVLNPTAITVYALLDGRHTVDEIADAVVAEYEVPREVAVADVHAFLADLEGQGMLAPPEEVAG
jgi:hypothetical protein